MLFQNSYRKIRRIGCGNYATVYLASKESATSKQPQQFAIKEIEPKSHPVPCEELPILKTLRHPNILKLYESYKDGEKTALVLEYAENGDLSKQAQKLQQQPVNEDLLANWIAQIALGLEYLHNTARIIHRDIKPHNILLMKNGLLKLADFGISKRLNEEEFTQTYVGTPHYISPEMIQSGSYDYKTDIWSFGYTIYEICMGGNAVKPGSFKDLVDIRMKAKYELPTTYPEWVRNLVSSMLDKTPSNRPDTKKILAVKQIQRAASKLRETYPEYKDIIEPQIPKTTKYLQRDQSFNMPPRIAESLKTAKRSQKPRLDSIPQVPKQKVDNSFYHRSLQFLVRNSQKSNTQNLQ